MKKTVTIFGKGNMGNAIGANFSQAGQSVNYIEVNETFEALGDIIVLAVPYNSVESILRNAKDKFADKIIIDITNPVNFETFDGLVVPADSSAAALIAAILPKSKVVKAFNTTFAATLSSKTVANKEQTTVLLASDHLDAKELITSALKGSGLNVIDAGSLKRARELEALGFLQISLAVGEKISWAGGFSILK